jgi:pheromone shutdown protein TraB
MPTSLSELLDHAGVRDDPRVGSDFCRFLPGTETTHDVLLVGVVHDHPASVYRAARLAEAFEPDVLGLELPPLAVAAFERAASTAGEVPSDEMCGAIAASPGSSVVGIDSFGPRFCRQFLSIARKRDASLVTIRRALGEAAGILKRAVVSRLDTARVGSSSAGDHDISPKASPPDQAEDERSQLARSRSLLGAIERPRADLLVDATREETMAGEIASQRRHGSVLAVVGVSHLDALSESLA